MGSYNFGFQSANRGYSRSYPKYNPTYLIAEFISPKKCTVLVL